MVKRFLVSNDDLVELTHKYCRNFTELERQGRFDPITGRDKEIQDTILILLQKNRKNACFLAPAGVGKTALVAGLAQQIVKGDVPEYLQHAQVLELDMPAMAAGTNSPAEFQERFVPICIGLAERYHSPDHPKYIMFIDEIHTIMPAVKGSAYAGLSEVMKPYLTVGDLHVLGATTRDEYRLYVQADEALDRRFQKIHLKVPSPEETIEILKNLRPSFEKHFKITIPDECLAEVVKLTERHMPRRNQPDKSVITLDASCAHHVITEGTGGELTLESVLYMTSRETGLHQRALDDRIK